MQFLWLVWWTKWWIETHRRNTAEKLLAHEAENFDDFEEFLEDAHRWWVEDDELIADAWATAKWLTNEERTAIKKDTANIQKQETKARELYEEKQNIESQLTQLRLTPTENETQIKKLETRLQEIDNNINEIDAKIENYMNLYWPTVEVFEQQPTPQQQWWENLSQQTMREVPVSSESQNVYEKSRLTELTEAAKQMWKNKIWNDINKKRTVINSLLTKSMNNAIAELATYSTVDIMSIKDLAEDIIWWKYNPDITIDDARRLIDIVNGISEYARNINNEIDALREKPKPEEAKTPEEYFVATWKPFVNFVEQDTKYSRHLVWVKNVNIKNLKWNITANTARRFGIMLAKVSQILWIDFNKVVNNIMLNVTQSDTVTALWWKIRSQWFMYPERTKEQLQELIDRLGEKADVTQSELDNALEWTIKAWIYLAKSRISENEAIMSMAHEFFHLLDAKLAYDLWLPLKQYTNREWKQVKDWVSVIEWDESRKTFKQSDSWNDERREYYNTYTEILSRYAEEYVAYKMWDKELFDLYSWLSWYWKESDFLALKDKFESLLRNEFSQYELDEWNRLYADLMEKLDNYMAKKQFVSDERWLSDIEKANPKIMDEKKRDEIKNTILEMEKEYVRLSAIADWLEWDIRTEIWNEYQVALSMLNTNLDMLSKLKDKYIDMTTNTKEQQTQIDEWVNNISDNWPELISEVEDNQQEWDIVDDAMKEDIEEDKEPDTTEPLDVAVTKVVNKVERSVDKMIKDKNKKNAIREVWQWIKDALTPSLSRLYSISPRLAWAVHVYQASIWLKTLWYKRLSENFVKELDKLKKKNQEAYKKLSLALFDWWMDESIDIKQSLKDVWLDEKLFEPVVSVLNQIATEYQSAWLDITINDKYFPRKVKDYWLLLDYLSRKSGTNVEWTKQDLLNRIKNINEDPSLSDWEKEVRIHNILINEFTKPSERSNNAKERKLILSEWLLTEEERKQWYKNDITDFYEDPIVSLSTYIDDMVKKTELKKMLWWLTNEKTAISEEFDDSIAKILLDMEARWELTPEKADEAKKVIKAIVNARATGKWAQWIKNAVYSMTIANRLSAAQQLEDLSKALLRWPTWFKNIVKSIIGRANIKMDDTWLENAFAQFEWWNITDTLFKLSWFDAVDALWKNSFLNTAWDSCVRQANSGKRNIILKTRLTQMYWEEMWNSIFESYKNNELRDEDWHLKLDVMVDLMYQLGNTQPIYKSAMPTAYLNNPKVRVVYCLWSFTVKQVDWFIQWTKEVYNNQRLLWRSKEIAAMAATWRCIWALSVVSIISAMVSDLINWAKWDDDELMFKKWEEEWFGAFLKQFWINSLSWLLKIFNISKYDQYVFKREWIGWVLMSKITPAPLSVFSDVIQVLIGKEELASMWKYMPLFLKPLYYQFKNRDMLPDFKLWRWETTNKKSKTTSDKFWKTSVWTKWPSNSSKFWWYSVQ